MSNEVQSGRQTSHKVDDLNAPVAVTERIEWLPEVLTSPKRRQTHTHTIYADVRLH